MTAYKRTLHEQMSEVITRGAFAWLTAVLAEIPVWSGASHATFLQLSHAVGYSLAISPTVFSRVPWGRSKGEGEIIADPEKGKYVFRYETSLEHLIFNEYNNANSTYDPSVFYRLRRPGPYGFQAIGLAAYLKAIEGVRLPSPTIKIKTKRV
jgi:hypothetical protein